MCHRLSQRSDTVTDSDRWRRSASAVLWTLALGEEPFRSREVKLASLAVKSKSGKKKKYLIIVLDLSIFYAYSLKIKACCGYTTASLQV